MTEAHHDGYERLMLDFERKLLAAEASSVGGRSYRRVAAGGLLLAGIAAGTVAFSGADGGHLDSVALAEAALAPPGQIVHLVTTSHMEMRGGSQAEIVGPEAEEGTDRIAERWSTSQPLRWRVATTVPIVTAHGTSPGNVQLSYDGGTEELYVKSLNTLNVRTGVSQGSPWVSRAAGPLGADPVARVRSMLEAGRLHDAGSGTVNGHPVERLVGEELDSSAGASRMRWPVEYDVNPATHAPVRLTVEEVGTSFRGNTGVPTVVVDVDTYEDLQLNGSNASLLSIHPTGNPTVERHHAAES